MILARALRLRLFVARPRPKWTYIRRSVVDPGEPQRPFFRTPETNEGKFFVDNRNKATEKFDRSGPYVATFTPTSGTLQVPSTDSAGRPIMVNVDGRVWLPIASGAKARSIVTNVATGISFSVVYAQRWGTQIEVFVKRATPS